MEMHSPDVKDASQGNISNSEVCEDYLTGTPVHQDSEVLEHMSKQPENIGEDCLEFKERGSKQDNMDVQNPQPLSQAYNLPRSSVSSSCKCRAALGKIYKCGMCHRAYGSICKLHQHLEHVHIESESYVFDILTQTAFPRYKSSCKLTQTETELLHTENREMELVHPDNKDTELPHGDNKDIELLHDDYKDTELLQSDDGKLIQGDIRNMELVQHEAWKTERQHHENKDKELLHHENRKTELLQTETSNIIEVVNDELIEVDEDLRRSFSDSIDYATDLYRNNLSDMNIGTDHPPGFVSEQTPLFTSEYGERTETHGAAWLTSVSWNTGVCPAADVGVKTKGLLTSKSKIKNPLHSQRNKNYIKPKSRCLTRRKRGKSKVEKMKMIAKEKGLLCKICDKAFPSKFALKLHNQNHHMIECDECGKTIHKRSMLFHKRAQHSNVKNYMCQHCGETFTCNDLLKKHLRKHQPFHQPFVCSYENCGKRYKHKQGLERHQKSHTGEIQQLYVCKVCGNVFKHPQSLKGHALMHSGEWSFKCDLCPKTFCWKNSLKRHMKNHSQDKPHVCLCGMAFSNKWNLNAHSRQHTGDKPYVCEVCGAQFTHNVSRKNHMKEHERV